MSAIQSLVFQLWNTPLENLQVDAPQRTRSIATSTAATATVGTLTMQQQLTAAPQTMSRGDGVYLEPIIVWVFANTPADGCTLLNAQCAIRFNDALGNGYEFDIAQLLSTGLTITAAHSSLVFMPEPSLVTAVDLQLGAMQLNGVLPAQLVQFPLGPFTLFIALNWNNTSSGSRTLNGVCYSKTRLVHGLQEN